MPSKIVNVATAAQLTAAIAAARGGETILLAPGNYGALSIKSRSFADAITIRSADGSRDAVITDLRIHASAGIRLEDIDLNRPLAKGEADFTQAAYISSSSRIAITGMDFAGSRDGNAANDGTGLRISDSKTVSITGSTFEQWKNAVMLSGIDDLTVSGNRLTSVVKAFDLTGLQNASFTSNRIADAKAGWITTAFAGKNVVFQDNVESLAAPVVTPVKTAPVTPPPAPPIFVDKTAVVSTAAQLTAAIAAAKGGETILLAPGDYGAITIKNRVFDTQVTIRSVDPTHDAKLSSVRIADSAGLTFHDVDVSRPLVIGEADSTQAVYVSGSSRIGFVGVDFTGSMDNNPWNDGVALRVSSSKDVKLVDSTFEQWTNAVVFDHDKGLLVAGNTVAAVREGFDFAAVQDVVIARNLFTAFKPNYAAGDHADSIQFWNNGVDEGSSNVVIRDNVMLHGASGGVQGIFVRAENPVYRHSNFTIENNLYNGDARHGITLTGTDGGTVRGNTVTSAPGGLLEAGINIGGDSRIIIERNVAPLLLDNGSNSGVTWASNIDLWDSKQGTGLALDSVFAGGGKGTSIFAYALKAGSAAATAKAGFSNVDGIGAAAFDLSSSDAYGHLASLLAPLSHLG